MANKRMFALDVIDTDRFCEMPVSARLLYYELGMRGDDEGFVQNPKRIMLTTGTTVDDLKILAAKGYVILFDSGVLVITHWNQNNTLKNDRFRETKCLAEKGKIQLTPQKTYELLLSGTNLEPSWNQNGTRLEPQHNLTEPNKTKQNVAEQSRVVAERPSGDCGGLFQEAERRARGKYDNASELDIQRELRDLQHAEQLARTYGLPQFSAVYSSMLDDVEKHGWEKLEGAIKEAAAANSRSGLSVNFYRAVLQNGAKPTNRGIPRSHLKDL